MNPILSHIQNTTKIKPNCYWDRAYETGPPKRYIGLVLWSSRHRPILDLVIRTEHIVLHNNYDNHYPHNTPHKISLADPQLFTKLQTIIDYTQP